MDPQRQNIMPADFPLTTGEVRQLFELATGNEAMSEAMKPLLFAILRAYGFEENNSELIQAAEIDIEKQATLVKSVELLHQLVADTISSVEDEVAGLEQAIRDLKIHKAEVDNEIAEVEAMHRCRRHWASSVLRAIEDTGSASTIESEATTERDDRPEEVLPVPDEQRRTSRARRGSSPLFMQEGWSSDETDSFDGNGLSQEHEAPGLSEAPTAEAAPPANVQEEDGGPPNGEQQDTVMPDAQPEELREPPRRMAVPAIKFVEKKYVPWALAHFYGTAKFNNSGDYARFLVYFGVESAEATNVARAVWRNIPDFQDLTGKQIKEGFSRSHLFANAHELNRLRGVASANSSSSMTGHADLDLVWETPIWKRKIKTDRVQANLYWERLGQTS